MFKRNSQKKSFTSIGALPVACAAVLTLTAGCQSWTQKPGPVLMDTRGMVPAPYRDLSQQDQQLMDQDMMPVPETDMAYEDTSVPMEPLAPAFEMDTEAEDMAVEIDIEEVDTTEAVDTPPPVDADPVIYTVKKGDSLWRISRMYGITHQELASYNDMNVDDILMVGQELEIPPGGTYNPEKDRSSGSTTTSSESSESSVSVPEPTRELTPDGNYNVVKGDSLWIIARRFDVKVADIKAMNDLKTDVIYEGQTLVIPKPAGSSSSSTGLSSITDNTSSDAGDQADELEMIVEVDEQQPVVNIDTTNTLEHTASAGETLDTISVIYGVPLDAIKKMNPGIDENQELEDNTTIIVPVGS